MTRLDLLRSPPWIEDLPTSLATVDVTSARFITANQALRNLVGYKREEFGALTLADVILPAKRGDDLLQQLRSPNTERVTFDERRIKRKDGAVLEGGRGTVSLLREAGAAVVRLELGLVRQERPKEELRTELLEREILHQKLLLAIPDALLLVSDLGTIVEANPAAVALFGYPYHELLGLRVESLIPQRLRSTHQTQRAGFFAAPKPRPMGTGKMLTGLRKDGTELPVNVTLNYTLMVGSSVAIAIVRDMSAQLAAADEQRARLQHASPIAGEPTTLRDRVFGSTLGPQFDDVGRLIGDIKAAVDVTERERLVSSALGALVRERVNQLSRLSGLSAREREVLDLVLLARTRSDIARALGVKERTAKYHVANALQKLGAESRIDLLRIILDTSTEAIPSPGTMETARYEGRQLRSK